MSYVNSIPIQLGAKGMKHSTVSNAGNRSSSELTKMVVLGDPDKSSFQQSKFKKEWKKESKHR